MKNKLIFSGCSYSCAISETAIPYSNWTSLMKKYHGYDTSHIAISGQSNESILKKIYDFTEQYNPTNSIFICQLTYTHRIGWWHNIANQWSDYQPNYINVIPEINEQEDRVTFAYSLEKRHTNPKVMFPKGNVSKDQYEELSNMYLTWLAYVYDEAEMFKYLLYRIDTLRSYVEQHGNKILFVYWPDVNDEIQLNELKKRNFFSIDNEYSILKWSTKNKLVDNTSHLSDEGNIIFSNLLNEYLENYNELKLEKISTLI